MIKDPSKPENTGRIILTIKNVGGIILARKC
jgi:hypothetical protein